MKTETAWHNSMDASSIEFNKNVEKALDLILRRISMSENRNYLGKFGVEFQKLRRCLWVAGGQIDISHK
jgi:hypothetical protein